MSTNTSRAGWILLLAYVAFISLGLPDSLIGVAWPSMRRGFGLPLEALGPYFLAGTAGYFLASFNSGHLVHRWGVGRVLAASSLLTTLCVLGCALAPAWSLIVGLSFFSGLGAGAIDAGINTYAALRFTPRHLNWLHAGWGIGAATGPAIMTAVLSSGGVWRWGYLAVAAALALLTLGFGATIRRWSLDAAPEAAPAPPSRRRDTLARPTVWLTIGIFMIYSGIEASAGQWTYSLLVEARGVPAVSAGLWVSLYWGALTAGRFLIGTLANRLPPLRLLRCAMAGTAAGLILLASRAGHGLAAVGLAATGFALAPIFPMLIALTPRRFAANHVANTVGLQVAGACLGLAGFPPAIGVLANRFGLEVLPGILIAATCAMFFLHEALERQTG